MVGASPELDSPGGGAPGAAPARASGLARGRSSAPAATTTTARTASPGTDIRGHFGYLGSLGNRRQIRPRRGTEPLSGFDLGAPRFERTLDLSWGGWSRSFLFPRSRHCRLRRDHRGWGDGASRASIDQRDVTGAAHGELANASQSCDQPRGAGRPAESAFLERVGEGVQRHRATRCDPDEVARDAEQLVVRCSVRLPCRMVHSVVRDRGRRSMDRRRLSAAMAAPTPTTTTTAVQLDAWWRLGADADRLLLARQPRETAVREPPERDTEAGGYVADRIEGAVIGDDLENVSRPRGAQPHPGGHRDPQIAPVLHSRRWRAVQELGAVSAQQTGRVVADDTPVADGDEIGPAVDTIDGKVVDDPCDVLRAARVLDIEEDGAPTGRKGTLGLGRPGRCPLGEVDFRGRQRYRTDLDRDRGFGRHRLDRSLRRWCGRASGAGLAPSPSAPSFRALLGFAHVVLVRVAIRAYHGCGRRAGRRGLV